MARNPRNNKATKKPAVGRRSKNSRLNTGQQFIGRVRDLASDGAAVVEHTHGQVFFVEGLWFDELAEIVVTGFRGRAGFGKVKELIESSPHRMQPVCPHHPANSGSTSGCGGCAWMFVSYPQQLAAKQRRIEQQLARFGLECILPILPAGQQLGYRNRAQFKSDGKVVGYMSPASNDIAAIDDCLVLSPKNRSTLRGLLATLPNPRFKDRHVRGKTGFSTLDIDETVTADTVSVNRRLPFNQPNTQQNLQMRHWLNKKLSSMEEGKTVLELFAGSGNFTEVIARCGFENIFAVEGVGEAIVRLDEKQLPGVTSFACNLFEELAFDRIFQFIRSHGCSEPGVLVLDPPRDGLKNKQGLLTRKSKIDDILYISCDLATFSRDIAFFVDAGFAVKEVQPIDQLPHTPHVELLAHLARD